MSAQTLILIDGVRLAKLMIRYNIRELPTFHETELRLDPGILYPL